MFKKIEREIQIFAEGFGGIKRTEFVHGTLYVTFEDDRDCDAFHKGLRDFYKEFISEDGGVNMYAVGGEFAFDFVPEKDEAPVFSDEKYSGKEGMMPDDIDKGVWSEFAEDEMFSNMPDDVDTLLNLEAESKRGK